MHCSPQSRFTVRRLVFTAACDADPLRALFSDAQAINPWLAEWLACCAREDGSWAQAGAALAQRIRQVSPRINPRNHRVELTLTAAPEQDDLSLLKRLLAALPKPLREAPALAMYGDPAPPGKTESCQTSFGGT